MRPAARCVSAMRGPQWGSFRRPSVRRAFPALTEPNRGILIPSDVRNPFITQRGRQRRDTETLAPKRRFGDDNEPAGRVSAVELETPAKAGQSTQVLACKREKPRLRGLGF